MIGVNQSADNSPFDAIALPDGRRFKRTIELGAPLVRLHAAHLRSAGFAITKPNPNMKAPGPGWSVASREPSDFGEGDQLGILGGPLSDGCKPDHATVIIEIDDRLALDLADEHLPDTAMIEGRAGKPRSHRYYLVPVNTIPPEMVSEADAAAPAAIAAKGHAGPRTKSLRHRDTNGEILKFVGTGGQVVAPPSVWVKDGKTEVREWEGGQCGEPAVIDCADLWEGACRLAEACGGKPPDGMWPWEGTHSFPAAEHRIGFLTVKAPSDEDRAIAYLAKCNQSVSGSLGHNDAIRAASALVWGFALDERTSLQILKDHFNPRCKPAWSDKELRHKVKEAAKGGCGKPYGWLRDAKMPVRQVSDNRPTRGASDAKKPWKNEVPATVCRTVGLSDGVSRPIIPDPKPFPVHCLPRPVRELAIAAAKAIGCDVSMPAIHAATAVAGAIGGTHLISPKRGWKEPCCLWTLSMGRSGSKKSPPYRIVEDAVGDIDDEFEEQYWRDMEQYQRDLEAWEAQPPEEQGPRPKEPPRLRASVQDVTLEALVGVLQDNPRGVTLLRDELSGWIGSWTRYAGKTGATDLPHWLQLSNAGTVSYIRKTGDKREIRVRGACVSVTGTVQPRVMAGLLKPEVKESGVLYRLLTILPEESPREWTDEEVPECLVDAYRDLLRDLYTIGFEKWPDGKRKARLVTLDQSAREVYREFYNRNGSRMYVAGDDEASARSKLEAYALRFALLNHVCRHARATTAIPVCGEDMAAGVELSEWFAHEATRVYAVLAESEDDTHERRLIALVKRIANRKEGQLKPRDLQRANGKDYPTKEAATAALDSLVTAGVLTESDGVYTPRPTVRQSDRFDDEPPVF